MEKQRYKTNKKSLPKEHTKIKRQKRENKYELNHQALFFSWDMWLQQ